MTLKHEKILVILDLDETLIHATNNPNRKEWDFELFDYKIYKRPYLSKFLEELKKDFEVAVWSSASDDYVNEVVKIIFPDDYPLKFVWGRSRATLNINYASIDDVGYYNYFSHYDYVKRLDKVKDKFKISKERMLIVDDTPRKCKCNYGNAIYPKEYNGEKDDNELLLLSAYLKTLKDVQNVRIVEKRFWKKTKHLKNEK